MNRAVVVLGAALVFGAAGVAAGPISRQAFHAQKESVDAHFDAAMARCKPLKGNEQDVCKEQARGARKIALAELELQYKPSPKNEEELRITRAEATYDVAREKCDALDGNAREVCRKDAKAMFATAKADAKLRQAATTQEKRPDTIMPDRAAADERQRTLQYAAARERCETLAGEAREDCLLNARKRFGKL